jgi:hypothetical protein
MGIFKRDKEPEATDSGDAELATIIMQGEDMMAQLAEAHRSWGLGTADQWDLDQTSRLITWTFADKTATAPAQILASYNPTAGSWLWAWANESVLSELSRDSRTVHDWAEAHGHTSLTAPKVTADDELANTLTAISIRVTKATGFYRGAGASMPIITFGPVTLTTHEGESTTFTINIDD